MSPSASCCSSGVSAAPLDVRDAATATNLKPAPSNFPRTPFAQGHAGREGGADRKCTQHRSEPDGVLVVENGDRHNKGRREIAAFHQPAEPIRSAPPRRTTPQRHPNPRPVRQETRWCLRHHRTPQPSPRTVRHSRPGHRPRRLPRRMQHVRQLGQRGRRICADGDERRTEAVGECSTKATPAIVAPVIMTNSKNRPAAVTGAPVMTSQTEPTSERPARSTTRPVAIATQCLWCFAHIVRAEPGSSQLVILA